jgi:hypothetical protein
MRHSGSRKGQGGRKGKDDPVQLERPWPSGPGLLRKILRGFLENYSLSDEILEAAEKVFENYPKPQLLKSW